MTKIVNCDCGRVLRGDTDNGLVAATQRRARDAHGLKKSPATRCCPWPCPNDPSDPTEEM